MNNNIFTKHNIPVIDSFIDKFAKKYIEQRSQTNSDISLLNKSQMFKTSEFDTSLLEGIISGNSTAYTIKKGEL